MFLSCRRMRKFLLFLSLCPFCLLKLQSYSCALHQIWCNAVQCTMAKLYPYPPQKTLVFVGNSGGSETWNLKCVCSLTKTFLAWRCSHFKWNYFFPVVHVFHCSRSLKRWRRRRMEFVNMHFMLKVNEKSWRERVREREWVSEWERRRERETREKDRERERDRQRERERERDRKIERQIDR